MGKGVKKKQVDKNVLSIKGSHRSYYPFTVTVSFQCSNPERGFIHPQMREHFTSKLNLPTFNEDKTPFTPAFKLQSDEIDVQHYKQKHKLKLFQYQPISQSQIMLPRPKDKRYCHVCQCRFQDYQEHIDSQRHRKVVRQDKYQHKIQKLTRKISKQAITSRPKTIKTTTIHSDRQQSFYLPQSKQNDKISTLQQPLDH